MLARFLLCIVLVGALTALRAQAADEAPSKAAATHVAAASKVEGGHEGEAGQGEHEKAKGPLDFKADLAIWTFVVFAILFAVLYKFAWGPISEALDKREHSIAENIAVAERANAEGKRLLGEYEAKMAKCQDEVRAILDEARRDAEYTQQEILAKARAEAEAEVVRGRREIEIAANAALVELATASSNLAVELAGKVLRAQILASDHSRLIDEALASFSQRGPSRN